MLAAIFDFRRRRAMLPDTPRNDKVTSIAGGDVQPSTWPGVESCRFAALLRSTGIDRGS
jgi:hypothetical protein